MGGCALLLAGGPALAGDEPDTARGESPERTAPDSEDGVWVDADNGGDDSLYQSEEMNSEVIEVWAERKDKPFDRDTELRLTQKQLIQRGATNLAEALDLLPDIRVRAAGRGGSQIAIRGARKGSIRILIDGVPISDPYYGNFDISSIPVTDIEQIRVSVQAGSPIDGTGGPGGVVEIHTRDAVGARQLQARFEGSSLPTSNLAATARHMLSDNWALRLSATGTLGSQEYRVMDPSAGSMRSLGEDRHLAMGAARLEFRDYRERRLALDSWISTRGYIVPPGEDGTADILVIDNERQTRNSVSGDLVVRGVKMLGSAYVQTLRRDSRFFTDASMQDMRRSEDLRADREGLTFLATREPGKRWQLQGSANFETEHANVDDADGAVAEGRASIGGAAVGARMILGRWRVDAAGGVAVPIGLGANPWPEAKLSAQVKPIDEVTFKLIGGHKGRIPTLRERFEDGIGNQALGPEKVLYGELIVETRPTKHIKTSITVFNRNSNGQIRFDAMSRQLINLGDLDTRGLEATATVYEDRDLNGGALWAFVDAVAERGGSDPLDFLPANRAEVWMRGRLGKLGGGQVRLRFLGEQVDRAQIIESRATLDLSAYARLGELTATVRVQNLTDVEYPLRAGVVSPGRVAFLQLLGTWK
ncbi:MAG: TonB-dependent receptor [Deltaproteobacteria bacterium]|nr:TonB-dependent receptor [Deltaproteobacteria bacterium]